MAAPSHFTSVVRLHAAFGHLTADFSVRMGGGMNIHIPFAASKIGGLRVGQRGFALRRTFQIIKGDDRRRRSRPGPAGP